MSNRTLVLLLAVCAFLAMGLGVLFAAPDSVTTTTREFSFDLKYLGFTGGKGEPTAGTYFSKRVSDEPTTSFTKTLNLPKGKGVYTQPAPQDRPMTAIPLALEVDGDRAEALYADLDGDGKLSPNEKILPSKEKCPLGDGTLFVTSDFEANTREGKKVPYRLSAIYRVLRIEDLDGPKVLRNLMFRTACAWEGAGAIEGKLFHLLLLDNDLNGSYSDFSKDGFALMPEAEYAKALEQNGPRATRLSRMIFVDQKVYEFRLEMAPGGARPSKVVFRKSEIPTSRLVLELKGLEPLKSALNGLDVRGQKGDIFFSFPFDGRIQIPRELPADAYQVLSAWVYYGSAEPDEWTVNVMGAPVLTVAGGAPTAIKWGEVKMSSTVALQETINTINPQTVFKKGDVVFCSFEIRGLAGEKYAYFNRQKGEKSAGPQVRIRNAEGKEVVSAAMQYG